MLLLTPSRECCTGLHCCGAQLCMQLLLSRPTSAAVQPSLACSCSWHVLASSCVRAGNTACTSPTLLSKAAYHTLLLLLAAAVATYQSISTKVLHFTAKENNALPQQQTEGVSCHVCSPRRQDGLPICLYPWPVPAFAVESGWATDDRCLNPRCCTALAASAEGPWPTAAAGCGAAACLLAWCLQGRHLQ